MAVRRGRLHYLFIVTPLLASISLAREGQIRLAGPGSTLCSGRVEIYHNKQWGTVCDDHWDLSDAQVVCRQMDCGTALKATIIAELGQGSGQIWLDDVGCFGSESSLTECKHAGFGVENCGHSEDAGVVCSRGQIRLVGQGSTQCSGRVEVYHNKQWGTVCDDDWDLSDAQVVCRQLNCGTAVKATQNTEFGQGSDPIWLDNVGCSGSESTLTQCGHRGFGTHDCKHNEDAGVVCSRHIPKPSISVSPSETVQWGQSVRVSCTINSELLGGTFILRNSSQDVQTSDSNPATFNFPRVTFDNNGSYHCVYQKVFSGEPFSSPQSDSVTLHVTVTFPKPRISVTPSKEVKWGQTGVSVTCSITTELSGGTFTLRNYNQDVQTLSSTHATFNLHRVTFDSGGPYHCVYQKDISGRSFTSPQSDSVTIKVSVELPQPTICVSSPDGGQQCSSDTVHVTRGYSFVISCSVHSDVPEGLFVLIFSGSNSDVSEPAVNHSASFHFPVSQDEHQGNYSCVYQVTGPGRTYTSETAPVKIIIKLPLLLVVGPSVAGGLLLLSLVFLLLCLVLKKRSTDERSDTNVQAQMSDMAGNPYVEDSDEDEEDYVNVDEPINTHSKHDSNQPMRSNTYMVPKSRTADSQDVVNEVRFVKVSEACFDEENREDDDFSDDEDDYENVEDDYENNEDDKDKFESDDSDEEDYENVEDDKDKFENDDSDEEDYENVEDDKDKFENDEEDYENVTDQL